MNHSSRRKIIKKINKTTYPPAKEKLVKMYWKLDVKTKECWAQFTTKEIKECPTFVKMKGEKKKI